MLDTVLNPGDAALTVGSTALSNGANVLKQGTSVLNGRGTFRNKVGVALNERNAVFNARSINSRTMDFLPQLAEPAVRLHLLVVDGDTAVRSACAEIAANPLSQAERVRHRRPAAGRLKQLLASSF
jgi:hypothetical protein